MYSFKEKNKLYYDLQNADFAQADLNLLCEVRPSDSIIDRAKRNPERHCNEVLYRLLDLKTADEIRLNRRGSESPKDGKPTAEDIAAKKADALAKMQAGKAAKKAEREAAKAAGKTADPKTPKVPTTKAEEKKDDATVGNVAPVTTATADAEKKK